MGKNQEQKKDRRTERVGDNALGLADDRLYRSIAARPRRRLLYYLFDADEATVEELAEVPVGWNATEEGELATTEDYERMVVSLKHTHLPALADTDLVTYDPARGTVATGEVADSVRDLVERSTAAEQS